MLKNGKDPWSKCIINVLSWIVSLCTLDETPGNFYWNIFNNDNLCDIWNWVCDTPFVILWQKFFWKDLIGKYIELVYGKQYIKKKISFNKFDYMVRSITKLVYVYICLYLSLVLRFWTKIKILLYIPVNKLLPSKIFRQLTKYFIKIFNTKTL